MATAAENDGMKNNFPGERKMSALQANAPKTARHAVGGRPDRKLDESISTHQNTTTSYGDLWVLWAAA